MHVIMWILYICRKKGNIFYGKKNYVLFVVSVSYVICKCKYYNMETTWSNNMLYRTVYVFMLLLHKSVKHNNARLVSTRAIIFQVRLRPWFSAKADLCTYNMEMNVITRPWQSCYAYAMQKHLQVYTAHTHMWNAQSMYSDIHMCKYTLSIHYVYNTYIRIYIYICYI